MAGIAYINTSSVYGTLFPILASVCSLDGWGEAKSRCDFVCVSLMADDGNKVSQVAMTISLGL